MEAITRFLQFKVPLIPTFIFPQKENASCDYLEDFVNKFISSQKECESDCEDSSFEDDTFSTSSTSSSCGRTESSSSCGVPCRKKSSASRGSANRRVCKKYSSEFLDVVSATDISHLKANVKRAEDIWNSLQSSILSRSGRGKYIQWHSLSRWQQLPFYWLSLSNELPENDPFDNFKRFYEHGMNFEDMGEARRQHQLTILRWQSLKDKQRLPFIMESFICKVGAGQVDICDEQAVKCTLKQLLNE